MNSRTKVGLGLVVLLLSSCAPAADDAADEQPADTAAMAAPATADATGTWNMRAVPVSGDTTPTVFQIQVTDGTWTLLLPDRDPIAATAVMDGDSIIVDAGPYNSVRRPGTTVSTHSVYRLMGDQLTGTTTAHYQTAGADSVLELRSEGTRAR